MAGRYDKTSQPWNSFYEIFKQTRVNVPTVPAYANNNPDYLATQSMGINPIALADADMTGYHYYYNKNFQSTFTLKYEVPFVQGLSIQGLSLIHISCSSLSAFEVFSRVSSK